MQHLILDMLKAYFKEESLKIGLEQEKNLVFYAKEQALLPFLYLTLNKKEYKPYYISAALTQEGFIKLQIEMTRLFNEACIPHLYLKGSILYELYPDTALRTRGDIDILVDSKCLLDAKNLLLQNGYELLTNESQHHLEFKKGNLMVELHFNLFDTYHNVKYFDKPFQLAKRQEQSLYAFTNEDHFLFCLLHFAHHLKFGAGIRYILDFYYMLRKLQMDKALLHQLIKEQNLETLYSNILNVIFELTEEELDVFEKYDVDFFLDYMLRSGIHGFGEKKFIKNSFGIKTNKFKAILSGTFMFNKAFRISLYPRLGKHWYFYPLCLFHRIVYLICTKTKRLFLLLFSKKNKVSKEEKQFYQKLGIM